MKIKALAICAGFASFVFVVGAVGVIAVFASQRDNAGDHEAFMQSIASGDPEELLVHCDPSIREAVDLPVLKAWMDGFTNHLGEFERFDITDFHVQVGWENGTSTKHRTGKAVFEHGTAKIDLESRGGKIIAWEVTSEELPDDWFQGFEDTQIYQEQGETFLRYFFAQENDQAFAMMHSALQEVVTEDGFAEMTANIAEQGGGLKSIAYADDKFVFTDDQRLHVYYKLETENVTSTAVVEFQFVGLKAHLMAFNLDER